jgi:hypothetical protein
MFASAIAVGIATALSITPVHHHKPPVKVVVSQAYVDSGGITDVSPPTRMDVVMTARWDGNVVPRAEIAWCLDSGGELIAYPLHWNYRPLRGRLVCEGVDY